jgi:hypothetical protein
MKKIVLRTGGGGLFLFLLLDCMLILGLIMGWKQLSFQNIGTIIGFIIVLLFIAYCTFYIFINRIIFSDGVLSVRCFKPGWPKIEAKQFDLRDIKTIYIGNEKYVRGFLLENKSWKTESKKFYRRFISHKYPGASNVSQFASSLMDVFVICSKEERVSIITTKPFSAAGFRRLIRELRKNNVEVQVGSKVLNRHL